MTSIQNYFNKKTEAAPLAVFRVLFGAVMFISIIRFWAKGWIHKFYIKPDFFFSYYGFEWVHPLGNFTYLIFIICGLSAFLVAIGYKYRLAIIVFFLTFTYIELMDKTTYLNHYYFISIMSFLLIFLPASAYFSVDSKLNPKRAFQKIPAWCIDCVKLLLVLIYFYAGLAKLNSDWLLKAAPLNIWLPANYDLPLLGGLLQQEWAAYVFSWSGMFYDLTIPFLLLWKRTRVFAFIAVVIFHLMTRALFPIGMFPYIMIIASLIFFDAKLHQKIIDGIAKIFRVDTSIFQTKKTLKFEPLRKKASLLILGVFFILQLLLPWRYLLYPGELFWNEEGFRFSWRVMLMDKAGDAQFKIVDGKTGRWFYVDNSDFLNAWQEQQMATQPDFILEYAHFLADKFRGEGHQNIEIYVNSVVALNGRKSAAFINPKVNLLNYENSFKHKTFLLPFSGEIDGI
jgi:hypothetical protein